MYTSHAFLISTATNIDSEELNKPNSFQLKMTISTQRKHYSSILQQQTAYLNKANISKTTTK